VRVALAVTVLSLAAWLALLMGGADTLGALLCAPADAHVAPWPLLAFASPAALVAGWALMVAAMMPPLIVRPLLHVQVQSLARRRTRAMLLFGAGYVSIWLAAGLVLQPLAWVLAGAVGAPWTGIGVAALLACLWQVSPLKQVCLNGCHRQPALAAFGLAADLDSLGFGVGHALWCVGTCGPLMLLAESVHTSTGLLAAMPVAALFVLAERFEPPGPFVWRLRLPLRLPATLVGRLRRYLRISPLTTASRSTLPAR
jgi:predicted metal-binding membrane protein